MTVHIEVFEVHKTCRDQDNRENSYGLDIFYTTDAECQKHCDALNAEFEAKEVIDHERLERAAFNRWAEHDALCDAGLRAERKPRPEAKPYVPVDERRWKPEGWAIVLEHEFDVRERYGA